MSHKLRSTRSAPRTHVGLPESVGRIPGAPRVPRNRAPFIEYLVIPPMLPALGFIDDLG